MLFPVVAMMAPEQKSITLRVYIYSCHTYGIRMMIWKPSKTFRYPSLLDFQHESSNDGVLLYASPILEIKMPAESLLITDVHELIVHQ